MDNKLLSARVEDMVTQCIKNDTPQYFGFLSEEEAAFAARLSKKAACRMEFFGGYEGARRVMLGCLPDWCEAPAFPIAAATFTYRKEDKLAHRDFLGAILSYGLQRSTIGDILVEDGRAVVFMTAEVEEYVLTQVDKVGKFGVVGTQGFVSPLPKGNLFMSLTATVESLRLDCVLAAICGFSRSSAQESVKQGMAFVNGASNIKCTRTVREGDILSVRGLGKFLIGDVDGRTKKNKVIVHYKKYL